jgi:hypothetical protein
VRAVLRTNVPGARWLEIDAAPFTADFALQSSDHKYIAFLRYTGPQPESSVWTITVAIQGCSAGFPPLHLRRPSPWLSRLATYLFCLFLFPDELLTPMFVRNVRGRQHQQEGPDELLTPMFVRNVRGRQHQQKRPEELLTPMFVGRWATSEPLTAKI